MKRNKPAEVVTADELRNVEIRDAMRGYNRDAVNALLERAAVTIEALDARVRELLERFEASR